MTPILEPPPLRGSFFLENGTLCDTREKNLYYRIQNRHAKKSGTKGPKKRDPPFLGPPPPVPTSGTFTM